MPLSDPFRRTVLVRALRDGDVTTAREVADLLPPDLRRTVLAWSGVVWDLVSLSFDGVSLALRLHTGVDEATADRLSRFCAASGGRTGRVATLAALAARAEADGRYLDAFSAWSAAAEVLPVVWALQHVDERLLADSRLVHGLPPRRDPFRLARSSGADTTERAAALAACVVSRCDDCALDAPGLAALLAPLTSRSARRGAELSLSLRYGDPAGLRRLRNSLVHEDATDLSSVSSALESTSAALVRRGARRPRGDLSLSVLLQMVHLSLTGSALLDPLDLVASEVERLLVAASPE